MMSSRILKMTFGVFALLAVTACPPTGDPCDDGYSKACPPKPKYYTNKIVEAKRFLANFEGQRARDVFKQVDSEYRLYHNKPHCEATYGVVLADAQVLVKTLNGLVFRMLTTSLSAAPPGDAKNGLKGNFTAAANPQDLGVFLDNGWTTFEPVLYEMSDYAETVTSIPKCTFSIGAGDPTETFESGKENPFKYVLNVGDSDLPILQLVLTGRFDGTEARLVNTLVRSVLGGMDFALAHDYSLTFDIPKILHQLGLPSQCVREDIAKCALLNADAPDVNVNLLGWSFIFADNPKLFGKSETRWDKRFSYVDNELAGAFFGMRTFFDSMVARSQALSVKAASDDELNQYILIYEDSNENGLVDAADRLGVNITDVLLSPEFLIAQTGMESNVAGRKRAETLRKDFKDTEALISNALTILRGGALQLSEGAVAEVDLFFERFYGNMRAVDFPDTTAERIPVDSFNTLIQDFLLGVFDSTPTPNFMELDLRAYFVDPKPLRKYLPYWEMTTDTTVYVGSRFLVDSDDYDTPANGTRTLPELIFTDVYGGLYYPATVAERALLSGTYNGGDEWGPALTGIGAPSDCVNANNIYSTVKIDSEDKKIHWPVMMFALQDASFNGVIYTDMGAWTSVYDPINGNGTGTGCPNQAGFLPATNYSITKSMWLYLDFLVDHFTLTQVLVSIGLIE